MYESNLDAPLARAVFRRRLLLHSGLALGPINRMGAAPVSWQKGSALG